MPQAVYILFGAVFTVLVATALGKLLLRGLKVRLYREEEHLLALVAGAPLLSGLVFLMCSLGVARKGVFLWVGLAILAAAFACGVHRPRGEALAPLGRGWKRLFGWVFGVFLMLYFSNAMAPEFSPDGSTYHLGLVSRYLSHHGFYRITTNLYANLSLGLEMLFLFAFAFGKHSAAALVHCAFLVTLPLLMLSYARRFGFAAAGVCAAIFVFVSPVVGIDGISAYNDVALAAVVFTVFYLLQVWDAERQPGLLVAVGLVAGFAYAVKYTAGTAVPYAMAFVAWKTWRKGQPWMRAVAIVAACALVPVVPWMAKNWIYVQNPFSPFFNALFPNPYVSLGFERHYKAYLRTYDLKSLWQIPLVVTVQGQLSGLLGPLFLLAPVALLAAKWKAGRQLLLAAGVFGATYFSNIGTRFLIPVLPFVSLAMAMAFLQVRWLAPALVVVHAVLSWPNVVPLYAQNTWRLTKVTYREALRIKPEDGFLHSNLTNYGIARLIERTVPPDKAVLTFTPIAESYTARDVRVVYQSTANSLAGGVLWTPLIIDYHPTWLLRFRFPRQPLRAVRVVQTARGEPDNWTVCEMRIYDQGRELERAPEWRLRAHPNPWYVNLAFDNSPVTRWSSTDTLWPGMFLEAGFGRPREVDSVLLEASHDQYKIRLKLEGQDASGKWATLAQAPEERDGAPMLGLRGVATRDLKSMGFDYFVVFDNDFGADDFRSKPDLWNIEPVGKASNATLYRIL